MIGDLMGRMSNAQKLSIQQLQQSMQNGTLPAYIGMPILQDKVQQQKMAQQPQQSQQPPIAQQLMQEASSIQSLPSNLPTQMAAEGGIMHFAGGGTMDGFDDEEDREMERLFPSSSVDQYALSRQMMANAEAMPAPSLMASLMSKSVPQESGINSLIGKVNNYFNPSKPKQEVPIFERAMQFVLPHEGGYVNHKSDRGGPTNRGITQNTLSGYLGKKASIDDVKNLSEDDARAIYKEQFWNPLKLDQYDPKTAMVAFNAAIASGPSYAKKLLKKHDADPIKMLDEHTNMMMNISKKDPSQEVFTKGWSNRQNDLNKFVNDMADGGITSLADGGVARFNGEDDSLVDVEKMNLGPMSSSTKYKGVPPVDFSSISDEVLDRLKKFYYSTLSNDAAIRRFREAQDARKNFPNKPEVIAVNSALGLSNPGMYNNDVPYDPRGALRPLAPEKSNPVAPAAPAALATQPSIYDVLSQEDQETGQGIFTLLGNPISSAAGSSAQELAKDSYEDMLRKRIMQRMEDSKSEREQNKYLAMLQAGLGILGGSSPNAMQNIGQGAKGIETYAGLNAQSNKEMRDLENQELNLYRYQEASKAKKTETDNLENYRNFLMQSGGDKGELARQQFVEKQQLNKKEEIKDARVLYSQREKQIEDATNKYLTSTAGMQLTSKPGFDRDAYIYDQKNKDPQLRQLGKTAGFDMNPVNVGVLPTSVPQLAIDALKKNPKLKDDFERKYGSGSANQFLGQ